MVRPRTIVNPSVRTRFVRRAKTLKSDREYQHAVREERRLWDKHFPDFAIGKPAWPPGDIGDGTRSDVRIYPPRLERERNQLPVRTLYGAVNSSGSAVMTASREWELLIRRLARAWWTERYFPQWRAFDGSHPANPFVAACLIWDLKFVSEELIVQDTALNISAVSPDVYFAEPGEVVFANTYARVVDAALEGAIASGAAMGVEEMTGLRERALTESQSASESVRTTNKNEWPLAVFLIEGMKITDWEDLGKLVMDVLETRYGRNPAYRYVRHLHSTGMTKAQIARELGLAPNHVSQILAQPETD